MSRSLLHLLMKSLTLLHFINLTFRGHLLTKCVTLCYIPPGGGKPDRWQRWHQSTLWAGDQIVEQDLPFQFQPAHLTPNKLKATNKFEL